MPSICSDCDKQFQRPEHLKRHITAVHERNGKKYACSACGKSFARADSCARHERTHVVSGGVALREQGRRAHRACDNCAAARAKCDGLDSCFRCRDRHLACTYSSRQLKTATDAGRLSLGLASTPQPPTDALQEDWCSTSPLSLQAETIVRGPGVQPRPPSPTLQEPSVYMPDMELFWPDNMNWLPVGDDSDLCSIPAMDTSVYCGPTRTDSCAVAWNHQLDFPDAGPQRVQAITVDGAAGLSTASIASQSAPGSATRRKVRRLSRYVDGEGGRDSLQKHARQPTEISGSHASSVSLVFGFPDDSGQDVELLTHYSAQCIGVRRYGELRARFNSVASATAQTFAPRLLPSNFPSLRYVEHCFQLYLRHTEPEWPIIHNSASSDESAPWLVGLAAVAAGSLHISSEHGQMASRAFMEFLRRALHCIEVSDDRTSSLAMAQASLLYVAISAHLLGDVSPSRVLTSLGSLRSAVAVARRDEDREVGATSLGSKPAWERWIAAETLRRIELFEWQLRFTLAMSMDGMEYPGTPANDAVLPCPFGLWHERDPQEWASHSGHSSLPTRVWHALERLYVARSVDHNIDAVGQRVLLYAVLARTREVQHHLQQPLREWSPAPDEESSSDEAAGPTLRQTGWLPANPQYAAWRNSACDCLDTLHWQANSEIAAAKGLEGPIILHLHLARLVLLCPYEAFICLAQDMTQASSELSTRPVPMNAGSQGFGKTAAGKQALDSIIKWITLDDHKQRLSLVHAGAIFWHVRRYSKGNFSEPFAIFVATMAIWFVGFFQPSLQVSLMKSKSRLAQNAAQNTEQNQGGERPDSETDDDTVPTSILLDRPCDDEIVQTFVRHGYKMQVMMSGAGVIDTPYGLWRVLQEGMKLLRYAHYANNARRTDYERMLAGLSQQSNIERT